MARLALSAVGAAVGGFFGGPLGAQLGFAAGSLAGSALLPQEGQSRVGPRLGDLSVSSSAFGNPIKIPYGTNRLNGELIWTSGIEEVRNVTEEGGKGGGSSAESVSFEYFATFAMSLGEGPLDDVLQIFFNGKLVFDKSGADGSVKQGLTFRFYPGDEDQLPDSIMEAKDGVGNVPAYRGQAYILFDRLPLRDYGNGIPQTTVVAAEGTTTANPQTPTTFLSATSWQAEQVYPDWERGFIYAAGNADRISRIRLSDMVEDLRQEGTGANPALRAVLQNGDLFIEQTGSYAIYDSNSLSQVTTFPRTTFATVGPSAIGPAGAGGRNVGFQAIGPKGVVQFIGCLVIGTDSVAVLKVDEETGNLVYVWGDNDFIGSPSIAAGLVGAEAQAGVANLYVTARPATPTTSNLRLFRITVSATAEYLPEIGATLGVSTSLIGEWTPTELSGSATLSLNNGLYLDRLDGNVIFTVMGSGMNTRYVKVDVSSGQILWISPDILNALGSRVGMNHARLENGTLGITTSTGTVIDTRTGEIIETSSPPILIAGGGQAYDSRRLLIVGTKTSVPASIYKTRVLGRSGDGKGLDDLVADLCDRSGLDPDEYDVTELVDTVRGYVVSRQSPVRSSLEILARAYFFDFPESDYAISFKKRGGSSLVTIPEDDFGERAEGPLDEIRTEESEIPESVTIKFYDVDRDYQEGVAREKRISLEGVETTQSRDQFTIDLPIAFQVPEPNRIAESILYELWASRIRTGFDLGPKYLKYDPADVVTLQLNDGTLIKSRITETNLGASDLRIEVGALSEEPPVYVSSVPSDGGLGFPVQQTPSTEPSEAFILDTPLLRDQDDLGGALSRVYYAASHFDETQSWPGAGIFRSQDAQVFEQRSLVSSPSTWGTAVNALAAPASPFATDTASQLRVGIRLGADLLGSVTQDQLLSGSNVALVGREIIQFRDVTQNADGSFTLSNLLRGRRGTDVFAESHVAGETFLVLETSKIRTDSLVLSLIGAQLTYRGVTRGQLIDIAISKLVTSSGNDLKPYAPVNAEREDDAPSAGDITISWTRRTRIGGDAWVGGFDIPLSEQTEAYEVDILDGPGGDVLRTLSSTSESVEYDTSDVVTDFGSPPATLYCRIYQLSATVGRGFSYEHALEAS